MRSRRQTGHVWHGRRKRVRITMRDGSQFIDVLLSTDKGAARFREHGIIKTAKISSVAIYKPLPHEIRSTP